MMPRVAPVYPGPLRMTEEENYDYVEAQAMITEDGSRIIFEEEITVNVDFGTESEERHSENCVCDFCKDVERMKMGKRTVITGGNGKVFSIEEESEAEDDDEGGGDDVDEDGRDKSDGDGGDHVRGGDHGVDEHDGEVIFAGAGKMTQAKISKPLSPKHHRMRKEGQLGASTSTISSVSTIRANPSQDLIASPKHNRQYKVKREASDMDSFETNESNTSGVTIAYSTATSSFPDSGESLWQERGRSASKDSHAAWDPQTKKESSTNKRFGMVRSLSKRSLSTGEEKNLGSEGSESSRTSKVWRLARSLSKRSNNSGHSSQTQQERKDEHAKLEAQMDESGRIEDQHSSFEERESLQTSFQGDEDIVEHGDGDGDGGRSFIEPGRSPELHDFPAFDPEQFTPKRRSGTGSDISTMDLRGKYRSGSSSLGSHRYSSRGSFSLNWDNISSDTVYHKHARRFYQDPANYGVDIPDYNPLTDNPYLAYDRYQEVSEWADSTEEADPDHVVALTTRELKRLCGEEIPVPFDFIPEGYVNPPNSKNGSVIGDDEDDVMIMKEELDEEMGPEPRYKNLVNFLGMPGWASEWEDMTKMQRHFHIVAAGDWRTGPVFDVKSNYSDYYGIPLFEPHDVGLNGVNRGEVRGLDIPGLKELESKFKPERSVSVDENGYAVRGQVGHSDEDDDITEYDSDGFLYDDDKRVDTMESFGPEAFTTSEAERIYQRRSDGGKRSSSNKSAEGSEYAGSVVEGYGTTDDHRTGLNPNINGYIDDTFRGRMAPGHTATGRLDNYTFTPPSAGSLSEESYDTDEDEDEDYESDDGISNEYSFGHSSYHGTECQEDYAIGTSTFAPHAFQLYPPYEAANDVTMFGITPAEIEERARSHSWDAEYMEDILGYSVHEGLKPRDPTAEMVLMSYLDPVPMPDSKQGKLSLGSTSRSRSSTGSLTPIPSPTKSTKSSMSFVPSLRSYSRAFSKNKILPPTPEVETGSVTSLRKSSLSTANIAKLNSGAKGSIKSITKTSTKKSPKSKANYKSIPKVPKATTKPKKFIRSKSKPAPPSSHSSDSDSNTSYVDLTRSGSAYAVPPAQSLILYLHGRGLSVNHIAMLLQPLDEDFLYNSASSWWPPTLSHISSNPYLSPSKALPTTTASSLSAPKPQPKRFPPHTLFTPTTVSSILTHCAGPTHWWEKKDACDPYGKILPESFKTLQREMALRKARTLVKKCVENFVYWRIRGRVEHGNLMRG